MYERETGLKGHAVAVAGGLVGSLVGSLLVGAVSEQLAGALAPCLGSDGVTRCPDSDLVKIAVAALGIVFVGCGAGASLAIGLAGRGGAAATGLGAIGLCALGFTLLTRAESVLGLHVPHGWVGPSMLVLVVLWLLAARRLAVVHGRRAARGGP